MSQQTLSAYFTRQKKPTTPTQEAKKPQSVQIQTTPKPVASMDEEVCWAVIQVVKNTYIYIVILQNTYYCRVHMRTRALAMKLYISGF